MSDFSLEVERSRKLSKLLVAMDTSPAVQKKKQKTLQKLESSFTDTLAHCFQRTM